MVTKSKESPLRLEDNKPLDLSLVEIAVVPTSKGHGVAIKGDLNGERLSGFVGGKPWAALKAFRQAGVIASKEYDETPEERYTIPILSPLVTVENSKRPGAKWPDFIVRATDVVDKMADKSVHVEESETIREITYPKPDVDNLKTVMKDIANTWYSAWQIAGEVVEHAKAPESIDRQDLTTTLFIQYNRLLHG